MDNDEVDPFLGLPVEVRRIQPFEATKLYICPGCSNDIPEGIGHYVVVPTSEPDLRRHWHLTCWEKRRRPGR